MILHRKTTVQHLACECFVLILMCLCFGESLAIAQFGIVSPLTAVNCSTYCNCELLDIRAGIQQHYQKHNTFGAAKFGKDFKSSSNYADFLGIFSAIVGGMISISCNVNDRRVHTISSLLNGIEHLKYSSLSVTCRSGEEIVWDIPSWQVSFNIFESKKCKLIPEDETKGLVIPMNMWIFEIENIGPNLIKQLDIRYTTNTLSFSVEGTDTFNIPDRWKGDAMISVDRFCLQSNKLKRFDCKIQFIKDLDIINLNNNDLVRFPECLLKDNNVNIRFLSISNNDISDISCLFGKKPFESVVKILDLSFNSIEKIGTFGPMEKLSILDLSNNRLTQINDDAFNHLHDLKQLHLQSNRISYIGSVAFRENVNLEVLKLSNNLLKFIQSDQFPPSHDILLDLRKNKLRSPPLMSEIKRKQYPSNIRVLSASNPLHCDCSLIAFEKMFRENETSTRERFIDLEILRCASPPINRGKAMDHISFIESCPYLDKCPLNCDCTLLNTTNFVINCTARRLLEMPEYIPFYPNAKIILDLSHNPLQLLGYRTYLPNVSELYMDNCLMTSVSPQAIMALQNVQVLRLHNNLLQKLPSNTKNITLKEASNVTLHNNRWFCSCDSLWLPSWISIHRRVVWKPGTILCNYLKKPVEDFTSGDVSCEAYTNKDVILALSMVLSSILSTVLLFFYYTKEIKLFLYTKLGIRLCTDFAYGDQFSPYDAFVSYGQDNYKWVVDTLVPTLEDGPKNYKLCLHYRDFPTNESNVENIPWAIRLSRCSILVLSKDFMQKEWCILELRSIFQRLLMSSNKLIIIATDDLVPDDLTPDLRDYIKTHEYLRANEARFWDKLYMFLPPKDSLPSTPLVSNHRIDDRQEKCVSSEGGDGDDLSMRSFKEEPYECGDCPLNK